MYEEITRYANSIRTLDENEATKAAKELGETLKASSLIDRDYYNTLISRGIDDPWHADAENIDRESVIAILSQIQDSDFWCAGSWRITVRSGYLDRLLGRLVVIDESAAQSDGQTEVATATA